MVIETSCSQAPPPPTTAEIDEFAGKDVVVRFHTTDGVTYATSRYAVTDSFVVIMEILRDSKYYQPTSAKLYGKADVQPPAKDVTVPVRILIGEIKAVENWEARSAATDVGAGLAIFVVIIAVAVLTLISQLRLPAMD